MPLGALFAQHYARLCEVHYNCGRSPAVVRGREDALPYASSAPTSIGAQILRMKPLPRPGIAGKAGGTRGQNRVRAMFDNADLTAEHVAKKTLAGIRKNDPIVLIGKEAKLASWARRLPSKLTDRLLGRV